MACVFCQIVAGEAPVSAIYRDQLCWALMDLRPVRRGHVLVVPTLHAVMLAELDDATQARMWQVGRWISTAQRASEIPCKGHNFLLNDGRAANQTVAHAHLHVIPRTGGDLLKTVFNLACNLAGLGTIRRAALDASYGQDGDQYGVFGRRFDSAGGRLGVELQIDTYTTGFQWQPDVAIEDNGDFVVVWSTDRPPAGLNIAGQRYDSGGAGAARGRGGYVALVT